MATWDSGLVAKAKLMGNTGTDKDRKIEGIGDFNGDGESDILWKHQTSGSVDIWDSGLASSSKTIGSYVEADKDWKICLA